MLSNTHLQKMAVKYQTSDLNVRREYTQHLLLSYLYRQPQSQELFFKGGTALRLIYKSPRFSEDLDFDTSIHDLVTWEKVVEQMLIDISREGIKIDIEEGKMTTGGYLGSLKVYDIGDPVVIVFEISFRKKKHEGEVFSIVNDFVPQYSVKSLTTFRLVEGKLEALFARHKARDFYDLYFMLRAGMVNVSQKSDLKKVLALLTKKQFDFGDELARFLPKSQHLIIHNFEDSLKRELERNI